MAKVTKKLSKKSKTVTTPTTETTNKPAQEQVRKVAPPMPEGMISVVLSYDDMRTFANLLSITAKTFEKLALDAANGNDEAAFSVLQARYRLSSAFAERLVDACKMPEPVSRDFH